MDIEIIQTSPLERQVDVSVDAQRVDEESSKAFLELKRRVTIKGFRPGKVPQRELLRRYGKSVRSDVIQTLIQSSILESLKKEELQSVLYMSPPEVVDDSGQGGFTFRFVAEVAPEIKPMGYLGVKVVAPEAQVDEDAVDSQIHLLQEKHALIEPMEERDEVAADDLVSISYVPLDQDRAHDRLQADHEVLDLASGRLLNGLQEGVTGMKVGETREVTVRLEEGSRLADEVGATEVGLSVEIHGIKRRSLPQLDDEFAQTVGGVETPEELRDKVREQLLGAAQRDRKAAIREQLEDRLIENHEFELPQSYLNSRIEEDFSQKMRQFQMAGLEEKDLESAYSSIRELAADTVKRRVRMEFILKAIADREKVTVNQEEVDQMVGLLVQSSPSNAVRMKQYYSQPSNRKTIEEQLRLDKTLDFLLSKTTILSSEDERDAEPDESEPGAPEAEAVQAAGETPPQGEAPAEMAGREEPVRDETDEEDREE